MQDIAQSNRGISTAPLVSIVTPFYNTGAYLSECIESVLQQTYENWEYILVNNCSTDNSVDVAAHYVRQHPHRIRLVHNAVFVSQLLNYNQALRLTSPESKYCKIVQADDFLFPQCVEQMVEVAEQDSSIGVVGSYALEGRFVCFDGIAHATTSMSGGDVCRLFFRENCYVFGSPTQLLIRSDLVSGRPVFYDESFSPFADAAIVFELLKSHNFGFVHQVLTFSRRDNQSIMQSLLDIDSPRAFELWMLRSFGKAYLEPKELDERVKRKERQYAEVLVDGIVSMRGKEFRKFHRSMLTRMGYRFWSIRVLWPLFLSICDAVLNPKSTVMRFVHAVTPRLRRSTLQK